MKILLTGKYGQVGYELERCLQGAGQVIAVDRHQMNLSDLQNVRDVIREVRPALIVNAAAYTEVDNAEREPALAMLINADAPAVMAEEARQLGAAMIHYSTDYVFDGTRIGPYLESDAPCPVNVYGQTKLAGEQAVAASGIPYLLFRTSWVYGMRGRNFLRTVQRLAQERDELRMVDDQRGAPTWCRTVAETTAHIVANLQNRLADRALDQECWREKSGLYHLAAQGQASWYGFAQTIVAKWPSGRKPVVTPISSREYPLPARRPANSVLSCEKLMATFCRLPDWETALRLCLEK